MLLEWLALFVGPAPGVAVGIAEKFAEKFIAAINSMTPDLADIYAGSHRQALGDWHARQVAMVTASGAGSAIMPGYHLAAMLADVAFVVNRVGVAGHGVGAILGYAAKLSGKFLSGFVPVLGAVVAGGVNAWIVAGILDAAKDYYTDKLGILGGEAAGRALPGGA